MARKPKIAPINDPDERDRNIDPVDLTMTPDGGAKVELPEEIADVIEQPDGSAVVKDAIADAPADPTAEFFENLADGIVPESRLATIATVVLEDIERDIKARSKRDELYAEGLKRTGLGNEAPGGANFAGASKAVHPALVEGCIDFAARAMKEIFPANGPVKTHIVGTQNKAKLQKAERKRKYMNWQLTTQIEEYRSELEVLLTQLPLGGSQYMKYWWSERDERIRCEFVPIDNLITPYAATNMLSAQRITHVQKLTRFEFDERLDEGVYRDIGALGDGDGLTPETTAAEKATEKIQGVEDLAYNEDGLRTVYETLLWLDLDGADKLAKRRYMPYVVTIDKTTSKICALRRNWDDEDNDKSTPLRWFVEYPFIPWRGGAAIGLAHIIGGMAGAATGALRALLDSAQINNMPGGIKLKGARVAGQSIVIEPTQLAEIDAGPGVDDIRKLAMPFPFNPPSTVLFQLLEWLTNQAKGVVATAEERIADASSNMPVGTALALIEQGSITFSSIHARLHAAQKQSLAIVHRLDAEHLTDHEVVEELDELVVSREDFQGPMDIEPVSDPNIFSDAQRYAQMQATMQLAAVAPQLYNQAELHRWALTLLKVPLVDEILMAPDEPKELDPIEENFLAATRQQATLKAYDQQRHIAHLKVHVAFMSSPLYAANPLMAGPLQKLLDHCREHILMIYRENAHAAAQAASTMGTGKDIATTEADGIAIADNEVVKELGPLMQPLQLAMQAAQQFGPKPPVDPAIQVAQIRATSDANRSQMENQLKQMQLQLDGALEKQRMFLEKKAHDDEMGIAARNADLATVAEEAQRRSNEQIAAMREILNSERFDRDRQLSVLLADMQREREQQSLVLQGLLNNLQAASEATVSSTKEGADAQKQVATQITYGQAELRQAIEAMMTSINTLAQESAKRRNWDFLRDGEGNLLRVQQGE